MVRLFVDNLRCLAPGNVVADAVDVKNTSVLLIWAAAGVTTGCEGVVFELASVSYTVRYWVASELVSTAKVRL